jgi:hypothetical protein
MAIALALLAAAQSELPEPRIQDPDLAGVFVQAADAGWSAAKTVGKDTLYLAAAPLRFSEESIVPVLATIGVVGVCMALDRPIREFAQHARGRDSQRLFDAVGPLGDDTTLRLYIYGGVVGIGFISGEDWVVEMGLTAWEAEQFTNLFVSILKKLSGRKRPSSTSNPFEFEWLGRNHSFPSGHVANVAPMMIVFSEYMESWVFDLAAYSMITLAAFRRIHDDGHWLSDVTASVVISMAVGKTLVYLHRNPDVRIVPWAGDDGVGLGMAIGF